MSDDLNRLADDYLHGLLNFEARRGFEERLETDPTYRDALEAARRRLLALEAARPPAPTADGMVNRVTTDVVAQAAADERRARRRKKVLYWVAGGVAATIFFLASLHVHYANLAANPIDLEVRGQDKLVAGSEASLRVRVSERGAPVADVPVEIDLHDASGTATPLARFKTDANGTASPKITLPEWADGEYRLSVVAHTSDNPERIEKPIKLRRSARVILNTDKPVYQPGQTIRVRSLAIRTHNQKPMAVQPAVLTVTDPKGNVVFKRTGETSRFGLFAGDCELADEINEGEYRLTARVGDTESSLAVDVRPYVLPKFKIDVTFDQPFFKANEPIRGRVRAVYFHGQPLQGQATVTAEGGSGRSIPFTIDRGDGRFQIEAPSVREEESNRAVRLTVRVTDTADQKHERTASVTVARHDLVIVVVPESGSLTTGLPTRLLFRVQTPDGKPVEAVVSSPEFERPIVTDVAGFASMPYTPRNSEFRATVSAKAPDGRTGWQVVRLGVNQPRDGHILTTDRLAYTGGETMTVIALGPDGLRFVDFLREGQTVRTEALTVQGGRGELAFDLPTEWAGEIDVRSYPPGQRGESAPSRRVFVTPADQVNVIGGVRPPVPPALLALFGGPAAAAAVPHRPGQQASLALALRDKNGRPVVGAVSVAAVDEAVFSVYGAPSRDPRVPASTDDPMVRVGKIESTNEKGEGIEPEPYSLESATLPAKEAAVLKEQARGHLRTMGGWAVLILLGFGYVCYSVWERAPRSMELAVLLVVPAIGLSTLVAGCEEKKMQLAKPAAGPDGARMSEADSTKEPVGQVGGATEIRVRRYFPETLLWKPELITDADGRVEFEFPFADSITSWRFTASAITADGRLGGWQQDVLVTQPFFVDINLPVALTRNDAITVPVVVSNYLKGQQTVRVELPDADWYTRTGEATREVTLAEGEVKAVEFRVKVTKAGRHPLTVTGRAGAFADAVRRDVHVNADGHRVEVVANGLLDKPASVPIDIPADAIEGSVKATLKLYPSGLGQLVDGMEGMFRAPSGCFEQTSSTTYPNVLALDYLRRNQKAEKEVEERARRFVHLGYQRLLTFEVRGGGFDWYGRGPANRSLTAYGLMEFRDMAKVYDVDPALIARTRDWLLKQRRPDGSWEPDWDPSHRGDRGESGTLRATAYIAWAAFQGENRADGGKTVRYLNETPPERIADPYVLALVCNALLAVGAEADPYLQRLAAMKRESPDGRQVWWEVGRGGRTQFYGSGRSGDVEATALAVIALAEAKSRPDLVRKALAWLVDQRSGNGTWGSTQATVLALKALLANTVPPAEERRFEVTVGGERVKAWTVAPDQAEVMQQLDLTPHLRAGRQTVELRELTGGGTPYQVTARHHVARAANPKQAAAFKVNLDLDRELVPVGGVVTVTASLWNRGKETAPMAMLELPIPPAFVLDSDLSKLVADREIDRVEVKPGAAILYLRALEPEKVREVTYRLRAVTPGKVTVPPATVYEYYDPDRRANSETRTLEVTPRADAGR